MQKLEQSFCVGNLRPDSLICTVGCVGLCFLSLFALWDVGFFLLRSSIRSSKANLVLEKWTVHLFCNSESWFRPLSSICCGSALEKTWDVRTLWAESHKRAMLGALAVLCCFQYRQTVLLEALFSKTKVVIGQKDCRQQVTLHERQWLG